MGLLLLLLLSLYGLTQPTFGWTSSSPSLHFLQRIRFSIHNHEEAVDAAARRSTTLLVPTALRSLSTTTTTSSSDDDDDNNDSTFSSSFNKMDVDNKSRRRRSIVRTCASIVASSLTLMLTTTTTTVPLFPSGGGGSSSIGGVANAAPPIAIIAEELGYFPVTNKDGTTVYVPARVKGDSTLQAVELAKFMRSKGAVMYGAYWCPHCSRQKEMFGKEAWSQIPYVECSPKGYAYDAKMCKRANIDGFPTWKLRDGTVLLGSGEMKLEQLAKLIKFGDNDDVFDGSLEKELPPMGGGGACQ